jgi:IclR family transcriptional regulator, pca regulon regulatory protein
MQISPLAPVTPASLGSSGTHDEVIQSLARGMEVLRAFGVANDKMTIAEAARVTGLTRAGARRILLTLEKLGYVRSDGRHYSLTARVLELGQGFLAQPLWQAVRPVLLSVANELNETASAGVLDGHDVVYTIRIRSSRILHLELRAGARLPAYACSIGRVLLASLPPAALDRYFRHAKFTRFTKFTIVDQAVLRAKLQEVRDQGWCHVHDEIENGVGGVSVPLIGVGGQTISALNVSANSERTSIRMVKTRIVPLLKEASAALTRELELAQ